MNEREAREKVYFCAVRIYIISSRLNALPLLWKNIMLHSITQSITQYFRAIAKILKTRLEVKDRLQISHEIQVIWFISTPHPQKLWETHSFWQEGYSELIRLNLFKFDAKFRRDSLVLTLALLLRLFLLYCKGRLPLPSNAWLKLLPWGW